MTPSLSITPPTPLPHQRPILLSPARFKIPVCGRRYGKTTICQIAGTDGHGPLVNGAPKFPGALRGANIWWIVPVFKHAVVVWEGEPGRPGLKEMLRDVIVSKNEVERRLVLLGGGALSVMSADNPTALVSQSLDGVIFDEAGRTHPLAWPTIRPALADRQGWAIFPSTPNAIDPSGYGRWYEELFRAAKGREDWETWQRPTFDNPMITAREIEDMRSTMASIEFRQEVLAEFVSLAGARIRREWFRYYRIEPGEPGWFILSTPQGEKRVRMDEGRRFGTVDLAASIKTSADYTAIGAWHLTPDNDLILLDLDRRRIEGPDQLPALWTMFRKWGLGYVAIERTGYQLTLIQAAVRSGLPARELVADRDKVARGLPLEARMEQGTVYFPAGAPWLLEVENELLDFPGGRNDDIFDICAYAAIEVAQAVVPMVVDWRNAGRQKIVDASRRVGVIDSW